MTQLIREQIIHVNMFHLSFILRRLTRGGAMPQNETFSDIGATIAENFNVKLPEFGKSFLSLLEEKV